jgi:hypothetical protein
VIVLLLREQAVSLAAQVTVLLLREQIKVLTMSRFFPTNLFLF